MTTTPTNAAADADKPEAQEKKYVRRNILTGEPFKPSVDEAWSAVMNEVLAVGKDDYAKAFGEGGGGFKFRGVDAVVNAVGPALRIHGVTVLPKKILSVSSTEYETKKGARMVNKQVKIRWEVRGPAGDTFTGESVGEAADSGDKAISKAQSVAYRVFLLQALCVPTGERDPDADVHERASASYPEGEEDPALVEARREANEARGELVVKLGPLGWDRETLQERFWKDYRKNLLNTTDAAMIRGFGAALVGEAQAAAKRSGQPTGHPAEISEPTNAPEEPITPRQLTALSTALSNLGIKGHDATVQWCTEALKYEVSSKKNLTSSEASTLIDKAVAIEEQQGKEPDGASN